MPVDIYSQCVQGTLVLAAKLFSSFGIDTRQVCIVARLVNLNGGMLAIPGNFGMGVEAKQKKPGSDIQIPLDLVPTQRAALDSNSLVMAEKFAAELREYFEPGLDRFPRVMTIRN